MSEKKLTPRTASTNDEICGMDRDNLSVGDYWMSFGENSVTLAHQRLGGPPLWMVDIPKAVFNVLVDFYNHGTAPGDEAPARTGEED